MRDLTQPRIFSFEEYLRIEEENDGTGTHYELVDGILRAMVGSTRRHARISLNIAAHLLDAADRQGCEVHNEGPLVRVAERTSYYPDVVVTCDPDDNDRRVVNRPCLAVEILSPSTASYDRYEKSAAYRRVPPLLTYLIVHQDQQRVERYRRDSPDADWNVQVLTEGSIPLPCPKATLDLAAIYRRLPE
jgi:Uma2 family endonuclease